MTFANAATEQMLISRLPAARLVTHTEDAAAPAVHDAVGVYEQCRCDPAEIDYLETHFVIDGVGLTCDRGLLFHVCSICCADEVGCSQEHSHGPAVPACPHIVPSVVVVAS
ncbi:hypothetical protein E3G68_005049 [Mycobacteroides abscessus]|uniref:hypothetical protein n=1 Tax=Mycobacteroides abscessus TaxID=36809 RepID=UPI001877CEDE|nr:hypothetical protein [Mycobacteroides abscessus]